MHKPYSESCEQNRAPIIEILRVEFADRTAVLEIGSGTGQHAVYFGAELTHLTWQTSDVAEHHPGINAWLRDAALTNVIVPIDLDVREPTHWPTQKFDAIFSANAVHIMSWDAVIAMFTGLGQVMTENAILALYGPFDFDGKFTSESNARFDQWLKNRDPLSGVRNFEDINALATAQGLRLQQVYAMPANNRVLVWGRGE
ncbi:MAG: DUF938 domain-containing protein [Pseudomonadota bacterium]